MPESIKLSRKEAIAAAIPGVGMVGFDPNNASAEEVILTGKSVPFVRDELAGRRTWRVSFSDLNLAQVGGLSELENPNISSLIVTLAPDTGHVLTVTSVWPKGEPRIAEYPTIESEEKQMLATATRYEAIPSVPPRVPLLKALVSEDVMHWSTDVKQIHACYITETCMSHENRPVWAIQLRGFTPFVPPVPPGADSEKIPVDSRNHIRNVVDAATGEWLGAGTVPQPVRDSAPLDAIEYRY
jgi:hypothetical protein